MELYKLLFYMILRCVYVYQAIVEWHANIITIPTRASPKSVYMAHVLSRVIRTSVSVTRGLQESTVMSQTTVS